MTSNPCREFDLTIAIRAETKRNMLKILNSELKSRELRLNRPIKNKIAKVAEAKFGLPSVEIMELYGFSQLMKSLPEI
jgi:hypothetical protein